MLFGSCFAENIGSLLDSNKFDVNINPFGILYNPSSIAKALYRLLVKKTFTDDDVFLHNGLYHSFLHHGDFSKADKAECLHRINNACQKASDDLQQADTLLITFGTAYVFKHIASESVVSNCHKLPASNFDRYRLSVEDIVNEWSDLINRLKQDNPQLNILFTVSPIRHWKDGAHDNQLSKAILLLAIDELQKKHGNIFYFPSYELLLDELRDYRFYAEDMIHPNDVAVKYIWESFSDTFFDDETMSVMKLWNNISQAINHRPFNAENEMHKEFLRQTLLKLEAFQQKYPYFRCEKEKLSLKDRLY